ncbi:xyloside xylosyltransferase 1 isoform X2 [Polypterus senegalus]|uniref:xyloside xylosyltransferase 1 isoform X2 n=1 Tax=Polypterus senegalus TaxID=55291 RepID=UPI0019637F93|nr:xyloside xylosyltransferase 1 isoform X2 [Polypterus senegalus]
MGLIRLLLTSMARVSAFRSYQFVFLIVAALAVVAFYYFGTERQNFSTTTRRMKQTQASYGTGSDVITPDRAATTNFHVLMMFTKADGNSGLQRKMRIALSSLLQHASFQDGEQLHLHFVSDDASKGIGHQALAELLVNATFNYEVRFHSVIKLTERLFPIVKAMQKHFSAGSGTYYSDAIFFLSVAMHRIMPADIKRIVQLDLDLKHRVNIRELFEEFQNFPSGAVIGIAHEMQPVYRSF